MGGGDGGGGAKGGSGSEGGGGGIGLHAQKRRLFGSLGTAPHDAVAVDQWHLLMWWPETMVTDGSGSP